MYYRVFVKSDKNADWRLERDGTFTDLDEAFLAVVAALAPPRSNYDAEVREEFSNRRVLRNEVPF